MPREPDTRDVHISKKLSRVLRHRVHENGLGALLRPDGFVPLAALLACPGFAGVSATDVERVAADSDKQRFALSVDEATGAMLIRANQGHTLSHGLDDEALLEPLPPPPAGPALAVHGTSRTCLGGICASGGLSRMARHHIHLAPGLPWTAGVISGMRASADVHIWVDLVSARAAGLRLFHSRNGVILTPGLDARTASGSGVLCEPGVLPLAHFARVLDARTDEQIPGPWDDARHALAAVTRDV
ncbi:hypothetical protein KFE25_014219 [Diacronema lutheri]|uniref:2'-phosphotransferase n=1 Tax=Diacronema lutheri TaxID=2081491 RepID=A0A8J6C4B8_DIALT|nr:hypothetical protein KFE25_014219 [Diacronema lutheri]